MESIINPIDSMNFTTFNINIIMRDFTTAFDATFCTNKKAHFDSVPSPLRVVDGARSRWCNLLLMDGLYYLSEQREINESSRRSFNQQQVLMECILVELRRTGPQLYAEYKTRSAVKESNELVLEGLEQPWDNIAALKTLFMSDPTTKSKEKFFAIIDCLTEHAVLRHFNFNVEAVFYDVICKVVFSYPHLKGPSCLTIKRKHPIIKQPFQSPVPSPILLPLDAEVFGDLGASELVSHPWEFLDEVMSGEFDGSLEARPQHPVPACLEESLVSCERTEIHSAQHGFNSFKSLTNDRQCFTFDAPTSCFDTILHSSVLYSDRVLLRPVATRAAAAPPPSPVPERARFLPPPIITTLPSPPQLLPISPFSPGHCQKHPLSPIESAPFPVAESAFHARRAYFFSGSASFSSSTDGVVYKAITPCARDRQTPSKAATTSIKTQEKESADGGDTELVLNTSFLGLGDPAEDSVLPRVSPMPLAPTQQLTEEAPDVQSDFDWDCFEMFCDDDSFFCPISCPTADSACRLGSTVREWSAEVGTVDQTNEATTMNECRRKRKLGAYDWEIADPALCTAT